MAHPALVENDRSLASAAVRRGPATGRFRLRFRSQHTGACASLPGFGEKLRASEEAARLFIRLCTHVPRTAFKGGSVLRELHDVGLLLAMVPEFAP